MEQALAATPGEVSNSSTQPMSFTGTTGEYFRIWIVNLALTVITVGIYSPWAKVRRNKYLYRNSHLAGASFDYHADPVAILKGRLIALGMLGLYFLSSVIVPVFSFGVALLIALGVPWLLVRSRMFAMRNTSYRNVRFRFPPIYGEAYKIIVGRILLVLITFGIYYPYFRYHRSRMIVDNTAYGTLGMHLKDEVDGHDFFGIYFGAGAVLLVAGVSVSVLSTATSAMGGFGETGEAGAQVPIWLQLAPSALIGLVYLLIYFGVDAAVARLVLENMTVGEHKVRCNWSLASLLWIQVTNVFAILLSLGLLIPWATIRMQNYKLANLALDVQENLADVAAAEAEEVSALGDEIGEAFDYDFGL